MGCRRLAGVMAALALAGGVTVAAPPAFAVSCVDLPDTIPDEVAAGDDPAVGGRPFFERYEVAVVGKVTRVRTDKRPGSPSYGLTRTTFAVHAGFGDRSVPATIDVRSDDPGWMSGFAFREGSTYFVPLALTGPADDEYFSQLCDPISELSATRARDLLARRQAGGGTHPVVGAVALLVGGVVAYLLLLAPVRSGPAED